jgi:hypothetical protein
MLTLRATRSPGAGDVMLTVGGVVSDCADRGACDPTVTASAATTIIRAASELIYTRPAQQQCCHVQDRIKCARWRERIGRNVQTHPDNRNMGRVNFSAVVTIRYIDVRAGTA